MLNPKTKERELVYTVTIDEIRPIEGYDRVEHARVGGWWVIVQKNQFKVGDLAIYFEIDSKVPETDAFSFLEKRHYKIKTLKMCKVISQGLLMRVEDFKEKDKLPEWADNLEVGTFLTSQLKVVYADAEDNKRKANSYDKYFRMKQRHLKLFKKPLFKYLYSKKWGKKFLFLFLGKKKDKKNGWPSWVSKTDEERCQNMPWLFPGNKDEKWIATEKIDGTSTTFTMKKGILKNEFFVCSRNVVFDKPDKECFYNENVYLEMAEKYNIENKLRYILENDNSLSYVTLQGETYGANIQKRDYSLLGHDFMAFNLIFGYKNKGQKRLNPEEMTEFLSKYDIPCVPIVDNNFIIPDSCEDLLDLAKGESKIDGKAREGLVFRSLDGIKSFKAVSNEFLLEFHQ